MKTIAQGLLLLLSLCAAAAQVPGRLPDAWAQSNVVMGTQPSFYSWTASPGATYYKFELYKDRVLGKLVSGTSGRTALPYWYNASQPGIAATNYDVDCSTTPGTCTLSWGAITQNATVDLSTYSATANTGPGSYEWVVTPWAAGPGTPVSDTFYLNTGLNPPPAKPVLYCPGQTMPSDPPYGRAGACNITSSNPTFRWQDVTQGPNDVYELYYGPITSSISDYFHAYIMRNASRMYAGPSLLYEPVGAWRCDGNVCTAATGTANVTSSILLSPGTYKWYLRGLNRDAAGALQYTGVWGNGTVVLDPSLLGYPQGLSTYGPTSEAFYPKFQWIHQSNASWHNVELTAKPLLSSAAVTKNVWLPTALICDPSNLCQLQPAQIDASFAYGINPAGFTWKVTPFNAEYTSTYAKMAQSMVYNGSRSLPGVPRANTPSSSSGGWRTFSWNASLASGSASYVEMYIFRYPFPSPFTWVYHEYFPIEPTNGYLATAGAGNPAGVNFGGPAASCFRSDPNWVCSVQVPEANMTKGDATDTVWGPGVFGWAVRGVNPIGYNKGSGLDQWGIGYFSR